MELINFYPAPQAPSQPQGTTAVINKTQKWFVGAAGNQSGTVNVFSGACVATDKIQDYQDHGELQKLS